MPGSVRVTVSGPGAPADLEQPHQIINSSDRELIYIALSTEDSADGVRYPDSGKYGGWCGTPGDPQAPASFKVIAREEAAVDYWDGESD